MKKKKVLIVVLLFLLTLSAIFAVVVVTSKKKEVNDETKVKKEQRTNVKETDAQTGEEYYLLADFENYFECSQVSYIASFGTVTPISKDKEPDMVPYGNQSVKLEILGTEESWRLRRPTMRFYNGNGFFNATTDFSNLSKISFDIYNAQDYEASIRFYVDSLIKRTENQLLNIFTNTDYKYNVVNVIDLKPNSWNHIEIEAGDIRAVKYDGQAKPYFVYGEEALKIVGGFNIEFDRGEIHEEAEVFYFDNLRAYLKDE